MVYIRSKKTLPHEKGHWSEKKQLEVVTAYLALVSVSEVARVCNVPVGTIQNWKTKDWWKTLVNDIQSGEGQRSDNKMSKTIDKALDLIMERMDTGDYQYDQKTGRLVKVPLKARDLERVASGLFDKRQLIRKQPTNIKSSDLGQAERLLALAEQFAVMAGKKVEEKVVNEFIEGDCTEFIESRNIEEQE
jgi:hypothetical protein